MKRSWGDFVESVKSVFSVLFLITAILVVLSMLVGHGVKNLRALINYNKTDAVVSYVEEKTKIEEILDLFDDTSLPDKARVKYTVDGTEYDVELKNPPYNLSIGKELTVYVDPESPDRAFFASLVDAIFALAVAGVIIYIVIWFINVFGLLRPSRKKALSSSAAETGDQKDHAPENKEPENKEQENKEQENKEQENDA